MDRQQETPHAHSAAHDTDYADIVKDVGFKVIATLGWLAWIPTALFLFVMLFVLYLMLIPWLASFVRWLGVDATIAISGLTIALLKLLLAILSIFGINIHIDFKKFAPSNLPWMMFGTIFDLFRPNRFTFLFFFVAVGVYLAVGMQYQ